MDICDSKGECTHQKNQTLPGCSIPEIGSGVIIIIISTCGGVAIFVGGGAGFFVFWKGADMHSWIEFAAGSGGGPPPAAPNPLYNGGHTGNPLFGAD